MIIIYHKDFTKGFKKLSPKIKEKFKDRLTLFEKDEFDPVLNNHSLKGKYLGYRSINVSGDIRAIFKRDFQSALFVAINKHSNLYR
jgi:addiction module RelE/StbE family toxin